MLRIASHAPHAKCFLQTDRGENYGNCEKTSGKKSRSCESTGKKSDGRASTSENPHSSAQAGCQKGN